MRDDAEDRYAWDEAKRARNRLHHGVDFADAVGIWDGPALERPSDRGLEQRFIAFGQVAGRVLALVYTPRAGRRRIISARMANRDERDAYATALRHRSPDRH